MSRHMVDITYVSAVGVGAIISFFVGWWFCRRGMKILHQGIVSVKSATKRIVIDDPANIRAFAILEFRQAMRSFGTGIVFAIIAIVMAIVSLLNPLG